MFAFVESENRTDGVPNVRKVLNRNFAMAELVRGMREIE